MRRLRRCLVVFVISVAPLLLAASAASDSTTFHTRSPISETFVNTCTGETFLATGFVHTAMEFTVREDGSMHERIHVNLEAMTA